MKVNLTRKTGFFGMGSPLKVVVDQEEAFQLTNETTKEFEVTKPDATLQVTYSFLKSEVFTLVNGQLEKNLQIRINPNILKLYMSLFTLIFILPLVFRSWELGVGILAIYVIFVAVMSRKFYIIEEID